MNIYSIWIYQTIHIWTHTHIRTHIHTHNSIWIYQTIHIWTCSSNTCITWDLLDGKHTWNIQSNTYNALHTHEHICMCIIQIDLMNTYEIDISNAHWHVLSGEVYLMSGDVYLIFYQHTHTHTHTHTHYLMNIYYPITHIHDMSIYFRIMHMQIYSCVCIICVTLYISFVFAIK